MKKKNNRFSSSYYKKGGEKSKQEWISNKIRLLENENKGRSHEQNIAIAFSLYNQMHKEDGGEIDMYQQGGQWYQNQWGAVSPIVPAFSPDTWTPYTPPTKQATTFDTSGVRPGLQTQPIFTLQNAPGWSQAKAKAQVAPAVVSQANATVTPASPSTVAQRPQIESVNQLTSPVGLTYGSAQEELKKTAKASTDLFSKQATSTTPQFTTPQQPYQFYNPYGGVDLSSALTFTGERAGQGDVEGTVVGGLDVLTKGARTFLGGFGRGKVKQEGLQKYYDDQYKNISGQNNPMSFERGGKMPCFECGGKYQDGGEQPEQAPQIDMQTIVAQVQQALQQGADPNQIATQLLQMGMPEAQIQQILQSVMPQQSDQEQYANGGYKVGADTWEERAGLPHYQEGGEEQEIEQEGQEPSGQMQQQEQQLVSQVAQALQQGVNPQQILQQMITQMQIPQEQAVEIVQMVMQVLQQQNQPQEQQSFQSGGQYDVLRGKTIKNITVNPENGNYIVDFE